MSQARTLQALVLEDQALIVMDLEASFETAGFEVVSISACAAASEWLRENTPTLRPRCRASGWPLYPRDPHVGGEERPFRRLLRLRSRSASRLRWPNSLPEPADADAVVRELLQMLSQPSVAG